METAKVSKVHEHLYRTSRFHAPQVHNLHAYRRENSKFYNSKYFIWVCLHFNQCLRLYFPQITLFSKKITPQKFHSYRFPNLRWSFVSERRHRGVKIKGIDIKHYVRPVRRWQAAWNVASIWPCVYNISEPTGSDCVSCQIKYYLYIKKIKPSVCCLTVCTLYQFTFHITEQFS